MDWAVGPVGVDQSDLRTTNTIPCTSVKVVAILLGFGGSCQNLVFLASSIFEEGSINSSGFWFGSLLVIDFI